MTRRKRPEAQLRRALVEHLRWGARGDTWWTHIPTGASQISHALSHNWSATVVALALNNAGTMRALIDEANA